MGYLQCSQIFKVRRKRTHRRCFTRCLEMCTGQCASREKRKEVSQLSTSFSYLASAPFISCSCLFDNFCCNYSFSLAFSSLSPCDVFVSQPLIFSNAHCSVWMLTLVWALSSECILSTLQRNSCCCTCPLPKCCCSVERWLQEAHWLLIPLH